MKQFFTHLLSDKDPSTKRFIGVIGGLSLIVYAFVYPSATANNSVLIISLGGLGLTTIDKIYKK